MRRAIGIGCRRGCSGDVIAALVRDTVGEQGLSGVALFTIDRKSDEAGLHAAATALGLPLYFLNVDQLAGLENRILTRSRRVASLLGVPSVAEAAALAGAGPDAVLAGPRLARDGATCALACLPVSS